jgi:recombination protein RecT
MNTNTQITDKKPQGLKALINSDAMRAQFALALPKHLTSDRFTRVCLTALTRTPKLQDCTPESFMRCLLDLSAMGLEPDGRRAHLIPYGKECTLVVDYKGIVELVMRSGMVSRIHADKVCANDEFEYDCGDVKRHKIDFKQPRGDAYAYYALVKFKDGTEKSEVMGMDEIEAIRNRSQGYKSAIQYGKSHPWLTDFDEMAKKTVFRRCSKWLQLSPEIRDALEKDGETYDETPRVTTGRVVNDAPRINPYSEPEPLPELTPEQPLEVVPESPLEVSEATERAQLVADIKATCHEQEVTFATFGGRAKKAGVMVGDVLLHEAPIWSLRMAHDNRLAILTGDFKA